MALPDYVIRRTRRKFLLGSPRSSGSRLPDEHINGAILLPGREALHSVKCKEVTQMESALSIKGQTTIPKAIRDHLHLEPGDRIKFFLHPDGSVVILPKIPASSLKGIVRARRKASLKDMETAIRDSAVNDSQRSRR